MWKILPVEDSKDRIGTDQYVIQGTFKLPRMLLIDYRNLLGYIWLYEIIVESARSVII